jgi:hypothetical protein
LEYEFRWNEWNVEHIAQHGVRPSQAEYIVRNARRPFPKAQGDGRFLVAGRTPDGDYLQVVYIFSPEDVIYVIHARPLVEAEKRRFRRRTR